MKNPAIMNTVTGIVGLAVAFIMFPILLTGVTSITGHAHIATFTGLSSVANVYPLIAFVGIIFGSGSALYQGVRGTSSVGMRNTMYLALGIVGMSISLIVFPVILDGCVTILGNASISSFTGLSSVVQIAPLILLVSIMFGAGFALWKGSGGSARSFRRRRRKSYASYR